MKIIECSQNKCQAWDTFLSSISSSSFYHLFGWQEIMESCFAHKTYYLAAIDNDAVIGVLPLVYINSLLFGKILCSMPFLNYGGTCSKESHLDIALLDYAKRIVNDNDIAYLELRNISKLAEPLPTSEQKVSMTLSLTPDQEIIWNNLKSKQRTAIRRAYKNDLRVTFGGAELVDDFYTILAKSWKDLGTPIYRKSFFHKILSVFPDKTKVFIVLYRDKPVAAAFNGYYKGIIEGMWLGTDPSYNHLHPSYILYWEMIKHGCENGCGLFHFGRSSTDSGGELFKKKWNAETKQLYWQYYLGTAKTMPQLNVQNPKFTYAIKLWRLLPLPLTTLIGPPVARNIP